MACGRTAGGARRRLSVGTTVVEAGGLILEHVPAWLGKALAIARQELGGRFEALTLWSPAFGDGARLPERFTADGAGVSPPLGWRAPPKGTAHLAIMVEDADVPARQPLVHAIVWGLAADAGTLAEGVIAAGGDEVGRNSFLRQGWLPPDPPTGHGEHRYAFQLFALDAGAGDPGAKPGRAAILEAMAGHVLAAGLLVGTYSRGEQAPVGPMGAAALP